MKQLDTYTIANFESRIEKFINEDKVALITSDALFKKYNKYECKVCKWKFVIHLPYYRIFIQYCYECGIYAFCA